jgi:hypothetical protein
MRRGAGAAAHGLLLLVALGVLFWDWTRETSSSVERVAIWELKRSELTSLELQMPGVTVDLELRKEASSAARYAWFNVQRATTPNIADPPPGDAERASDSAQAPPTSEASASTGAKEFLGSARVNDLLDELANLTAERELGPLDFETLERLGLGHPLGHLIVRTAKGEHRLEIGERAVESRLRYVRLADSGSVYVVTDRLISDLEQAERRLLNRELFGFRERDVETVVVRTGEAVRRYVQQNRDQPGRAFWAGAETPDREDERVSTWLAKLFQIRVERYLAESEDPLAEERQGGALVAGKAPAQATLVLRVELDAGANGRDQLELSRLGEEGAQAVYVVRTEHTHSDVVVEPFYAGELTKDLADLFQSGV